VSSIIQDFSHINDRGIEGKEASRQLKRKIRTPNVDELMPMEMQEVICRSIPIISCFVRMIVKAHNNGRCGTGKKSRKNQNIDDVIAHEENDGDEATAAAAVGVHSTRCIVYMISANT
jgi:hypothetical protein